MDTELRDRMMRLTNEWKQGVQSKKAFCAHHAIGYHKFNYWCRKLGVGRRTTSVGGDQSFIEVDMSVIRQGSWAEIVYPDGRRLLLHRAADDDFLRSLLN